MAKGLWERAREDLTVHPADGPPDPLVWEHGSRVAALADHLTNLPELASHNIDKESLTAAALYHDAGWVLQVQSGEIAPRDMLLRPTSELQYELAADWMPIRLEGIVPPGPLQTAVRAVRQCNDRNTQLIEAMILAESDSLDQIGPQAISLMIRKQLAEGRTLSDVAAAWQRQEEYQFWQARIKESFRWPTSQAMAQKRWQALRRFMHDLQAALSLDDLRPIDAVSHPSDASQPVR